MTTKPYNPLNKLNLARSIEFEILSSKVEPLHAGLTIEGAGVYLIYYTGDFGLYRNIAQQNKKQWAQPIYVGKAIPQGGRKGGVRPEDAPPGRSLQSRLRIHARSIVGVNNLSLEDFHFRFVILDDIWIPLGENVLIERFKPLWNVAIDGFGNNPVGIGRTAQKRSAWDVLHPGRRVTGDPVGPGPEIAAVRGRVEDFFAGRELRRLPRSLRATKGQEEAGET